MERRLAKINISRAGGTAGKDARTCKITLPNSWVRAMQLDAEQREVELLFDGEQILIALPQTIESFFRKKRALGHTLCRLRLYDQDMLCTEIAADFSDKTLVCENHTRRLIKTAFGANTLPVWEDFQAFLEDRCIPRNRDGLKEYLEAWGLEEYDPLQIILKTHGRMAEDQQWLQVCFDQE